MEKVQIQSYPALAASSQGSWLFGNNKVCSCWPLQKGLMSFYCLTLFYKDINQSGNSLTPYYAMTTLTSSGIGRKHFESIVTKSCSPTFFSFFPTIFSNGFFFRVVKSPGCVVKSWFRVKNLFFPIFVAIVVRCLFIGPN